VWDGLVKAFNYIKDAIGDNIDTFKQFGILIAEYVAPVIGKVLGDSLTVVGKIAGGVINVIAAVIKVIIGLIDGAIDGINALIKAYNAIPFLGNIGLISKPNLSMPSTSVPTVSTSSSSTVSSIPMPDLGGAGSSGTSGGGGGGVSSAAASGAAAAAASSNVVTGSFNAGSFRMADAASMTTIAPVINIGVAGDPEGVARTVVDVLNRSYGRGALGAEALLL
jgi:hypothetical protein